MRRESPAELSEDERKEGGPCAAGLTGLGPGTGEEEGAQALCAA